MQYRDALESCGLCRDGESLKPLNQAKQDTIRQQPPIPDWTAQLVPNATINDMAKDKLIVKSSNGKKWLITEIGEKELYS